MYYIYCDVGGKTPHHQASNDFKILPSYNVIRLQVQEIPCEHGHEKNGIEVLFVYQYALSHSFKPSQFFIV